MSDTTREIMDRIFNNARTYNKWTAKEVDDAILHEIYDAAKMAPTSANCSPLRIIFIKSPKAKARLKPHLMEGNVEQTMSAPLTAIFAQDMAFYEELPFLYPHTDAKSWFTGNDDLIAETAFRNATLQAGYFILAARASGLDCGPMSGFDSSGLNQEFFPDGRLQANFLCNLGYGDPDSLHPRSPRFDFDQVCQIL